MLKHTVSTIPKPQTTSTFSTFIKSPAGIATAVGIFAVAAGGAYLIARGSKPGEDLEAGLGGIKKKTVHAGKAKMGDAKAQGDIKQGLLATNPDLKMGNATSDKGGVTQIGIDPAANDGARADFAKLMGSSSSTSASASTPTSTASPTPGARS